MKKPKIPTTDSIQELAEFWGEHKGDGHQS